MTGLIPFIFVLVLGFGIPAMAQDPVITINPDGSIAVHGEMPLPKSMPAAPAPESAPMSAEAVEVPMPEQKPPMPVKKAKVQKPVSKPEPEIAPAREPIPYRDPAPAYVPPRAVEPAPIPAEGISRDDARRIALTVAPPSRSVMVYPANLDGHPVFEVIFKTYDGDDYVVLIDQPTGEIIKPKKQRKTR